MPKDELKIAKILEDFDFRLKHIEDAILDHRDILIFTRYWNRRSNRWIYGYFDYNAIYK